MLRCWQCSTLGCGTGWFGLLFTILENDMDCKLVEVCCWFTSQRASCSLDGFSCAGCVRWADSQRCRTWVLASGVEGLSHIENLCSDYVFNLGKDFVSEYFKLLLEKRCSAKDNLLTRHSFASYLPAAPAQGDHPSASPMCLL